jgi:hypothetical protein
MIERGEFTDGLSCTTASATTASLDTILFEVGVVCVTRTRVKICFRIILWALILVLDEEAYRRSKRDTTLDARLYMHKVLLVSLFPASG